MTAVIDQVKNVAYTSVGVNLIISDAVANSIREQRPEIAERIEEQAEKLFSSVKISVPEFVEEQAEIARKHGADALIKFHEGNDTRASKLEERLPTRVGEVMSERRQAAWEFLNVDAPVAKKAPAKKASAKKTSTKKASAKKADTTEEI